jgi:hypothetical protein
VLADVAHDLAEIIDALMGDQFDAAAVLRGSI